MTSLAIETHGLGKRFGARAALESIDLEVARATPAPRNVGKLGLSDRVQAAMYAYENGLIGRR